MKASRIVLTSLLALAAAALVAGCGEVSKADYEKDVKKIGTKVDKEMESLESGDQPEPADLEKAEKALTTAADDLEDVTPPSEVEDLHDDLVTALRDGSKAIGAMAPLMEKAMEDPTSLSEEEMAEMTKVGEDVEKLGERMEKVEKGFEKKDYDLGFDDEDDKG